ncbi:geranylgeranyl pyrophosphate synthase, partial [mine drainage metagenome]
DILGLFGEQADIGKSIKSDVNEGKKTLLMLKAIEMSRDGESAFIKQCLESGNVPDEDFYRLRKIVESSGSLDYSTKLIEKLTGKSREYLSAVKGDQKTKEILAWLSDYIIKRKN